MDARDEIIDAQWIFIRQLQEGQRHLARLLASQDVALRRWMVARQLDVGVLPGFDAAIAALELQAGPDASELRH
jgi:hypothetical protein